MSRLAGLAAGAGFGALGQPACRLRQRVGDCGPAAGGLGSIEELAGRSALRGSHGLGRGRHAGESLRLAASPAHFPVFGIPLDPRSRAGVPVAGHPVGEHGGICHTPAGGGGAGVAILRPRGVVRRRAGAGVGICVATQRPPYPYIYGGSGAADCGGVRRLLGASGPAAEPSVRRSGSSGKSGGIWEGPGTSACGLRRWRASRSC